MASSNIKVVVVGVGMTKFEKPGRRENFDYPQMVTEAVTKALTDAGLHIADIQQVCCGYVYGESTSGQRAFYEIGMTGVPIFNVNNNCSTGASALLLGKQIVESGNADCVLAVGFEKMESGSLGPKFDDRTNPLDKHIEKLSEVIGINSAPFAAQLFAGAGLEHMKKYGTKEKHFAKIAYKNHLHSVNNPNSQFQGKYSLEQIMNSPMVSPPLTKLQCCPTSDGAAAAILVSEQFARSRNLLNKAVEILAMEMVTDTPSTFSENSAIKLVGYDMTKLAAEKVYRRTGLSPANVDVIELHDCFSVNELITYEALGLCPVGKGAELVESGNNTYGGKYVVNPSGGLISKGHPLGATGIAQCAELCWQLRGEAGARQMKNAKIGLQHNIGLGGAVVVALYKSYYPSKAVHKSAEAKLSVGGGSVGTGDPSVFKVNSLFKLLEVAMQEDAENLIENVRGIYCFKVKNSQGQEGMWIINAKNGKGSVTYNGTEKPDVTFIMKDEDVLSLISGKMSPQKAFFEGKVKIIGNMGMALKLVELQKRASSKIEQLRSKL